MRIGGEHTDRCRRGGALDLPDDARLADAGGTRDQDRYTAARPRRRDRRPDAPHHVDASDEGRDASARLMGCVTMLDPLPQRERRWGHLGFAESRTVFVERAEGVLATNR